MQEDPTFAAATLLSDDWFLQDYFPSLPMQLDQQGSQPHMPCRLHLFTQIQC